MSLVWKKSEKCGNYEETNLWNAKITNGKKANEGKRCIDYLIRPYIAP